MLYTPNHYDVICQLYLSKGKGKLTMKAIQPRRSQPCPPPGEAQGAAWLCCLLQPGSKPASACTALAPAPWENRTPVPTALHSPRGEESGGTERPGPACTAAVFKGCLPNLEPGRLYADCVPGEILQQT